ncbi:MAG TPA: L,D-transpeptidase [Longimicrobium sp.]|nr:L,D-transpeptidase [Longimicrobium sp.]
MSTAFTRSVGALALLLIAVPVVLVWSDRAGTLAPITSADPAEGAGAAFLPKGVEAPPKPPKPRRPILAGTEVVVNIPSGRLELMEGGNVVVSYPVSVGSARYATPRGDYLLATVIWNPWWHPPKGSAWAANRKATPPGPSNPMGRVKLHMDELIYIHGTTSEGRLGAPASHGCIRMANSDVVDLARRLHRLTNPAVTDAELARLSATDRRTRETVMRSSVRMRVTYRVAQVRDGELHVFPDVYGRFNDGLAPQVRLALAANGIDAAQITPGGMERIRAGARSRGGASFAIADLGSLRAPERPAPPPSVEPAIQLAGVPVEPAPADTAAAPEPPVAEEPASTSVAP